MVEEFQLPFCRSTAFHQSEQRAAVGMYSARNSPDRSYMVSRRVPRPWPCCVVWVTGEAQGVFANSNFFSAPAWISLNVEDRGSALFCCRSVIWTPDAVTNPLHCDPDSQKPSRVALPCCGFLSSLVGNDVKGARALSAFAHLLNFEPVLIDHCKRHCVRLF